jgi:hypothetical protein
MAWPRLAAYFTAEQGGRASKLKEPAMHTHQKSSAAVAVIGIDIGKNTIHLVGLDKRGAIVLRVVAAVCVSLYCIPGGKFSIPRLSAR